MTKQKFQDTVNQLIEAGFKVKKFSFEGNSKSPEVTGDKLNLPYIKDTYQTFSGTYDDFVIGSDIAKDQEGTWLKIFEYFQIGNAEATSTYRAIYILQEKTQTKVKGWRE